MVLGDICTRACRFCAVRAGEPAAPDPTEPERLAEAVAAMGVGYAVITAVARDDLPDEGAGHFARCVRAIQAASPGVKVEVLPADFHARPELIESLCAAGVAVYNHNLETVRRLAPEVRWGADYDRSLRVLRTVRDRGPDVLRKSGLMVGLGETYDEVLRAFEDLLEAGCQLLTVGQYLQPGPDKLPVQRYWHPEEFLALAEEARGMGFLAVAAGPLVRSSFRASSLYNRAIARLGTART